MDGLTKLFRAMSKEEGKTKFEETLANANLEVYKTRTAEEKSEMVMAICVKLDTLAETRIARKDPLISPHCPSESLILVKRSQVSLMGGSQQ